MKLSLSRKENIMPHKLTSHVTQIFGLFSNEKSKLLEGEILDELIFKFLCFVSYQ